MFKLNIHLVNILIVFLKKVENKIHEKELQTQEMNPFQPLENPYLWGGNEISKLFYCSFFD